MNLNTKLKSAIVIPARYESTRLPLKMLLAETGKPLIQHTYEAAAKSKLADAVIVATDHTEIQAAVESFGGRVVLTDVNHISGTDRVAEVAGRFDEFDLTDIEIVVNVQGDEPEIEAAAIDRLIDSLAENERAAVSTLAAPIRESSRLTDPSCVKVVLDASGNAMYFSRSPIPAVRDEARIPELLKSLPPSFLQHVGVYAYRRKYLLKIPSLPATRIEQMESLEQLRFLDAGWPIRVEILDDSGCASKGIDTPEDYALFVKRTAKR